MTEIERLTRERDEARTEIEFLRALDVERQGIERAMDARIAQALRERDEARAALEWQPIETAPKDGTRILITNGGWVQLGWYSHSFWLGRLSKEGAWVCDDPRDSHALVDEDAPTRWRSLPPPPEGKP